LRTCRAHLAWSAAAASRRATACPSCGGARRSARRGRGGERVQAGVVLV
jgi:hypothetical protein